MHPLYVPYETELQTYRSFARGKDRPEESMRTRSQVQQERKQEVAKADPWGLTPESVTLGVDPAAQNATALPGKGFGVVEVPGLGPPVVIPGLPSTAQQLADEMARNDAPAPPPLFMTANGKGPGLSPDFERIVEATYQIDYARVYREVVEQLEIGEGRGDYGSVREHLDKAERRARDAHRLYLVAKLELVKWEADHDKVWAAMRDRAHATLQAEKDAGERSKAITDADVESRMAREFPDEYEAQKKKRAKVKGTVEHLERIAELWKNRCFNLSSQLSNLRK